MTTTLLKDGPTFSLAEVADLCGTSVQVLRNWVARGILIPTVRGGKGPGNSHQVNTGQVYALAVLGTWRQSPRGCLLDLVREMLAEYSEMPWSAVRGMLNIERDEFSEEAVAKALPGLGKASSQWSGTLDEAKELLDRVMRIRAAVLNKLSAGGRISGSPIRTKN